MIHQHTPGPWKTDKGNGFPYDVENIDGELIARCPTDCADEIYGAENARRIVACVNAIAHLTTEELETGRTQNIVRRCIDAEKQRDELLAALENAVSVAKTAHECWDNDQDAKVGKYLIALLGGLPGYDKRTDEIHAAIYSVKGGAA